MRSSRMGLVILALAPLLATCRDGVAPFAPAPRVPSDAALVQLTFNVGDEQDPQWSPDGTSLVYHTDLWAGTAGYRGILLRIPAEGGTAELLVPAAQPNSTIRLHLPVPSPDGERIAYLHMVRERTPFVCRLGEDPCPLPGPLLDTAVVRVRALEALGSVYDDVGSGIRYPGATRATDVPLIEQVYPYHLDYQLDDEMTNLRPAWSPDGQRLVFSDGTRLLLWQVGAAAAVPIPNTEDGVAPQWSPDGQRIAFGILRRGTPVTWLCECGNAANPLPITREGWALDARLVAVVRPDGSDLEVLTDGSEPAWTPDGAALVFRRDDAGLFRIAAGGGAATAIPETAGARAPAISPDGSAVAFARRSGSRNDFNIWRLELQP